MRYFCQNLFKKRVESLPLCLLFILTSCLGGGSNGSLGSTQEAIDNYISEGEYVGSSPRSHGSGGSGYPPQGNGRSFGAGTYQSTGELSGSGLNYNAAVQLGTGLPEKGEFASAMSAGNPMCAKGVRFLVNTLFGKSANSDYANGACGRACQIEEDTFNKGGLGSSSNKGYRYREADPESLGGSMPEGSIVVCHNILNPDCKDQKGAGHAEMFIGGKFRSGANDTDYSLCLKNGKGRYIKQRVYVLEKI